MGTFNPFNHDPIPAMKAHMALKESLTRHVYKKVMLLGMSDAKIRVRERANEEKERRELDAVSTRWD